MFYSDFFMHTLYMKCHMITVTISVMPERVCLKKKNASFQQIDSQCLTPPSAAYMRQ